MFLQEQLTDYFIYFDKQAITKQLAFLLICLCSFTISSNGQSSKVDSLKQIVAQNNQDTNHVKALDLLASYYGRRDLKKSLEYGQASEALARKINYPKGVGIALSSISVAYMDTGETDTAEIFNAKAIEVLESINNQNVDRALAGAYSIKGHLENNKYNRDKAFELFLKAAKICETSNDAGARRDIPIHYNNIALLYKKEEKYEKGLEYALRAWEASKTQSSKLVQGVLLTTIGRFYYNLKYFDKALETYNQALTLKTEINDKIGMITLLAAIGSVYFEKEDYKQAEIYFRQVTQLSEETNYLQGKYLSNFNFAKLYFIKKEYQQAILYAKNVLKIEKNQKISSNYYLQDAYDILAKSYAAINQYDKAYEYQLKYTAIQDTISQENQKENIAELETKYQVERKEQEKAAQAKILAQQEQLLWIVGISLIIMVLAAIFLFRLLRQRTSLSQSLRQKNEELRNLDEAKTRFFANVSHEFKTPLTLILSPIKQLLKTEQLSPNATFLIKSAERNSTQLFELTNQILELTKFDVNSSDVVKSEIDFVAMFQMVCASFQSLAENQSVQFSYQYHGKAPLHIQSDSYKIRTIIKNLISNAIKHSGENGKIEVNAFEKDDHIEITVSDNGQGIHQYDLPHIFDRFYQSKNPKSLVQGGTGIGLAICKEYTQLLGGNITVQSEWNKGSIFTFTIEKVLATSSTAVTLEETITTPQTAQTPILSEAQQTILVVEDNLDMQAYLEFILKPHYNVLIVPHGKAALQQLKTNGEKIDLVVTDLMMPIMNGYELIEQVKADSRFKNLPVIMLTALHSFDKKIKALRIGINDYISKPFEAEELLLRIAYLLEFQKERKTAQIPVLEPSIVTEAAPTKEEPSLSKEDEAWLEELEQLCMSRFSDVNLTVAQIAYEMAISNSKFWRKLRQLIGMTPAQYLQEIRFREARKYIEEQRFATVKQLAYAVGFKDERNFSRNFKKRFGKYPSAYLE